MRHVVHGDNPKGGMIKFITEDAADVSTALAELGITELCVRPSVHAARVEVTAYFEPGKQAEDLLAYLVRRASCQDKLAWQQDHAHQEIIGWCDLCEAANQGECRGWCLMDLAPREHAEFLGVGSAEIAPPQGRD